jgi:hypothetical protein
MSNGRDPTDRSFRELRGVPMRARLLLGALVLALATAGCGGDDDEDSGNGTSGESAPLVSKAEFIEQADELCTDFREKSDELAAEAETTSDTGRQAEIWRELADEAQATGEEFEQLPVPAGDQAIIDRYLSASRDQIGVLRQIAEALDDGDTTSVTTLLDSGRRSGARVQGIAQGYGFKVCGSERG